MRAIKGIKGIRKFLAEDRAGWHVYIDDEYRGYFTTRVSGILAQFPDTLIAGWAGNGLTLVSK